EETRPTILKEVYLYRIFKDIQNIALCYFSSYFILTSKKKRLPIIGSRFLCLDLTMNKYEVQNE
ncbi:hypothetical protein ACCB44_05620, partial [Staphylococcus aureus]